MDGDRFDHLVRGLVGGASRRGLLHLLGALPVVGGLVSIVHEADAKKGKGKGKGKYDNGKDNDVAGEKNRAKRRKKQCNKRKKQACVGQCGTVTVKCKHGKGRNAKAKNTQVDCGLCCDPECEPCFTCVATTRECVADPDQLGESCGEPGQTCHDEGLCVCDDDSCGANATCEGGLCVCDSGFRDCDGVCIDVQNDHNNCGGCGVACPAGGECNAGICACPSGQRVCEDTCIDNDVCCIGTDCEPSGNTCVDNQCQCGSGETCSDPAPHCCGNPGSCTNTQSDPANCGQCAKGCSVVEDCVNGICTVPV